MVAATFEDVSFSARAGFRLDVEPGGPLYQILFHPSMCLTAQLRGRSYRSEGLKIWRTGRITERGQLL